MFQEGKQIGSYTLIKKLGKGGFGEVWLAEKSSQFVTKRVAVKLPLDEQVKFEAIRQEATLWEQASGHANVLPIIDADVYDGQVVIVSEYADGGSLADKLKREEKLSLQKSVEMMIGILNGLEFLHSRRIIHRDIKPQNILLQGETPRLTDFGISRAMQATAASSTIVGTDAYMSPETFDGNRSVQTDIWAVGVVLYQLLTGALPFPQDHPTERMFAILMKDFTPLPGDIPPALQNIVKKALAKNPSERFQTAAEMSNDLKDFLYTIASPVKPAAPLPVTELANKSDFSLPTNQGNIAAETVAVRPPAATSAAATLIHNAVKPPLTPDNSKKPLLIVGALAAVLVLLLGTVLTIGFFVYKNFTANNPLPPPGGTPTPSNTPLPESLTSLSKQDMEMILEDSSPEQLKTLADNPDKKKKAVDDLKQLLAIAAEAEADGYSQKPAIKPQLEFIEKQVAAVAYNKRKNPNDKTNSISSVSDADAKAFSDKPENEQKFKEFVENSKELGIFPKDRPISDKELAEAKSVWAKIQIAYDRAMTEKNGLSEKERRRLELQVKLQKAQFLAKRYTEEVLTPKFAAKPDEIADYQSKHPEFETKTKKARAEEILQRIKNGEDFAKLANEVSEDPGSKKQGGLYLNVKKGQFIPAFEQAALALEPGQITENPVETQYGYEIIKLVKKGETYDVRHILISTRMPDPDNPSASPVGAAELVKNRIEAEKEKKFTDEMIVKHKITVADDFKVS